ncbi:nitrite/sulfite reductase [Kribbella amoyensis]|uniref:nitrite/sulfite reductase n=1 Tax=Kribbella amoyensis TaxID=996641 RepID=UPI001EE2CF2F|nr:nitrite/sulfite reductase [Kribbella amoyensis]
MHEAADGGLARVRLPGGLLTADQLRVLLEASTDLGDGRLELTSRGNLQIRALRPGAPQELSDRLYAAGLLPSIAHERVRNILASPLSGLDQHSRYDVLPAVAELDRLLCADPRYVELPGRFLFALDDGRGDLATAGADVGVRMVDADLAALLLAGEDTGVRVTPERLATVLAEAAVAFLDERSAQGSSAWRLAELAQGPKAVLARMSTENSTAEQFAPGEPVRAGRVADALVAVVPLGSLERPQAEVLAQYAVRGLRVTPWRSVVLPGLADDEVVERIAAAGLVVDSESPWNKVTACAGRPGCAKALADVRAEARRVTPRLPARHRAVHWSGCERRCGQPGGDFVDVLALADGYSVDGGPAATAEQSVMRMR